MAKTKRPPQTRKKLGGPRVSEGGPRQNKVAAVEDIQRRLSDSAAVVLTEYRGMTVHELAELRASLREIAADYRVYKNTLASIAARNLGLESLTTLFEGPTAFTFSGGDAVVTAKRLSEFARRVPTLVIKGGLLEGKVLTAGDVDALAKLESREVMLAKAAGMMLAPVQQAVNLLAAAFNQVGSLLVQLRDKLPAEGGAPDAGAATGTASDAQPGPDGDAEGQTTPAGSDAGADAGAEATNEQPEPVADAGGEATDADSGAEGAPGETTEG